MKQKKNRTPFLDRFPKKWQKVLVIILLFVFIVCLTMTVLLGFELLFFKEDSKAVSTASPSPSSSTVSTESAVGTILPLTSDAGRTYLDDTLFLGDSNTVRFMSYLDEDGNTFTSTQNTIAVVGMGVQAIDTLNCEQLSSGTYTMTEAVPLLQPQRIIITFGTNNLDGTSTDASGFITEYTKQLKEIEEAYPSVDIIVNSIPPVAAVNQYPKVKPTQIELYNNAIIQMCEENNWKYLNSYEVLCDSATGYAKTGYTAGDGLHLSQTGLQALFTYIRTHAYITTDDRPQPLAAVPTIVGPLTTLYTVNPLTNEEFSQDVLNPTPEPTSSATASSEAAATPSESAASTPTATPATTVEPTAAPTTEPTTAPTAQTTQNNAANSTNNSSVPNS